MTTVVGITAGKGCEGIVLASDLTGTRTELRPVSEGYLREETKEQVPQKIYVAEGKGFAFAGAGLVDDLWTSFIYDLRTGKIDLRQALERGGWNVLPDIHLKRFKGYTWNHEGTNSLLIASRLKLKPQKRAISDPMLFTCFPLGKIETRFYTAIGSGSKHALNYLADKGLDTRDPREISIYEAMGFVEGALDAATSRDIYSGGLEMTVVTRTGIRTSEDIIVEEQKLARQRSMARLRSRVKEILD
jgi:hypothetical protein